MNPYEVYTLYLAIQRHFTTKQYDYFKYNGKVNAGVSAFEARTDKRFFYRLSKHKDPLGFLLAVVTENRSYKLPWVGELFNIDNDRLYNKWATRQEALVYKLSEELEDNCELGVKFYCSVYETELPKILLYFHQKKISPELLIALNQLSQNTLFEKWDRKIIDPIWWPKIRDFLYNYQPFINLKKGDKLCKLSKIIVDKHA